jgi:hypothetical protein
MKLGLQKMSPNALRVYLMVVVLYYSTSVNSDEEKGLVDYIVGYMQNKLPKGVMLVFQEI